MPTGEKWWHSKNTDVIFALLLLWQRGETTWTVPAAVQEAAGAQGCFGSDFVHSQGQGARHTIWLHPHASWTHNVMPAQFADDDAWGVAFQAAVARGHSPTMAAVIASEAYPDSVQSLHPAGHENLVRCIKYGMAGFIILSVVVLSL